MTACTPPWQLLPKSEILTRTCHYIYTVRTQSFFCCRRCRMCLKCTNIWAHAQIQSRPDTKQQCNKIPIYHKNHLANVWLFPILIFILEEVYFGYFFFLNKKWIEEVTTVLHCSHGAKSLHSETAPVNPPVIQIHKYTLCFCVLPRTLDRPWG